MPDVGRLWSGGTRSQKTSPTHHRENHPPCDTGPDQRKQSANVHAGLPAVPEMRACIFPSSLVRGHALKT